MAWIVVTMKYLLFKFDSGTASKSSDSLVQSATTLLQGTDTDTLTVTDTDTATAAHRYTDTLVRATIFFLCFIRHMI